MCLPSKMMCFVRLVRDHHDVVASCTSRRSASISFHRGTHVPLGLCGEIKNERAAPVGAVWCDGPLRVCRNRTSSFGASSCTNTGTAPTQNCVRTVVLIERFKDDDFITRIEQREGKERTRRPQSAPQHTVSSFFRIDRHAKTSRRTCLAIASRSTGARPRSRAY